MNLLLLLLLKPFEPQVPSAFVANYMYRTELLVFQDSLPVHWAELFGLSDQLSIDTYISL